MGGRSLVHPHLRCEGRRAKSWLARLLGARGMAPRAPPPSPRHEGREASYMITPLPCSIPDRRRSCLGFCPHTRPLPCLHSPSAPPHTCAPSSPSPRLPQTRPSPQANKFSTHTGTCPTRSCCRRTASSMQLLVTAPRPRLAQLQPQARRHRRRALAKRRKAALAAVKRRHLQHRSRRRWRPLFSPTRITM